MTTNRINIRTAVTQPRDLVVEWNANMNRLRVADPETDETLAVYSNGEIYRVMREAPLGSVTITVTDQMPRIVESLVRGGIIKVTSKTRDAFSYDVAVTAEVLIKDNSTLPV